MTHADLESIVNTLREDINLKPASPAALEELAAHARRESFAKGEYVFKTGDEARMYHLVESGRVILSRESPGGRIFTYQVAVRGIPLNAVACFKPRARLFSARVAEDAGILTIPGPVFRAWVLDNPDVAAGIINTMGDLLDGAYTRIMDMVEGSVEDRILNALCMLSSKIGSDLPLTNADVAELVGTSRETAARVISRFKDIGLIEKSRGSIRIIDRTKIMESATSPFFLI